MASAPTATKADRLLRAQQGRVDLVDVPELLFLSFDGVGSPDSGTFTGAVKAIYAVAYGLRYALRDRGLVDVRVFPLEGQWWSDDPAQLRVVAAMQQGRGSFDHRDREAWRWRLLLRQPDEVTPEMLDEVVAAKRRKLGPGDPPSLVRFHEGLCAQTLHVGPYAEEPRTLALLHSTLRGLGYVAVGRHHEVYLGDPRRAAPERLRTILRQPVMPRALAD